MAKPIEFAPTAVDARSQLIERLQDAPQEHAEALLDAYDILRLLHEKGILELMKGALGSGEKVLQIFTETLEMKETVRTLRNFAILTKIIGGLDPRLLEGIQAALNDNIERSKRHSPPGMLKLAGTLTSCDGRRALGVLAGVAEAIGQHLITAEVPTDQNQKRKPTTRHQA